MRSSFSTLHASACVLSAFSVVVLLPCHGCRLCLSLPVTIGSNKLWYCIKICKFLLLLPKISNLYKKFHTVNSRDNFFFFFKRWNFWEALWEPNSLKSCCRYDNKETILYGYYRHLVISSRQYPACVAHVFSAWRQLPVLFNVIHISGVVWWRWGTVFLDGWMSLLGFCWFFDYFRTQAWRLFDYIHFSLLIL